MKIQLMKAVTKQFRFLLELGTKRLFNGTLHEQVEKKRSTK